LGQQLLEICRTGDALVGPNTPCEVILYTAGRQNKGREPENVDRTGEEMKRDELRCGAVGNLKTADSENFKDKCVMNVIASGFLNSVIPNKEIM